MEDKETLIREIEEDTNRVLDSWPTPNTEMRGLLKSAVLSPVRRNQLARRFAGLIHLQGWA